MRTARIATAATVLLCGVATNIDARSAAVEPMTTIVGVVRNANVGRLLKNVTVRTDDARGVAQTDSAGRFVLQTSRQSRFLAFSKQEYLEFQLPVLELTTDTVFVDVELRTDPPMGIASNPRFLPLLCVVFESPKQLVVTNSCAVTRPAPEGYVQQIIKHNP